jgi:UDP:flavonoid glycosyltransferase YjiC (YdhE family)
MAAAFALRQRGHETVFVGDEAIRRAVEPLGIEARALPSEYDLGPRLVGAIRDAMQETGGDMAAAGPMVQDRMTAWARDVALPVTESIDEFRPDATMTSLFGVEVLDVVSPDCPWAVVNSTFYIGPNPPRPVEMDIGPRAIPLLSRYASLLGSADLVLHATDQTFDYGFSGLPERHHYVGPLGIWEPPSAHPTYLDDAGDPWVLVTISSQLQDDIPLAESALQALAPREVRVLLTVGPDHAPDEVKAVPANAKVERTVPHSAVLEGAALLVSHAGHGSVMKSLWYGCPMVLVPWGRDQPGVAARAAALGVAEVVPRESATPEALADAITRVMTDDRMRQAAAGHASRLRETKPPDVAATLLEDLVVG